MRTLAVVSVLVSSLLLGGCSTLQVIPVPVESGTIDQATRSLTITRDGITLTASYEPLEQNSPSLGGMVGSFLVTVKNATESELMVDVDSFLLIDDAGKQYHPLLPAQVKEILTRDSYYLIPYPYVGFYYLEDYERSRFVTRESSSIPYYFEVNPSVVFARSFSYGAVIPGAEVTGLVHFAISPERHKGMRLLFFKKGMPRSVSSPFIALPFSVAK